MKRCEILLSQNESLTAIADQLGYSDQSALARAYKNLTGQTLLTRKKQLQLIQKMQRNRILDAFCSICKSIMAQNRKL